MDNALKALLDQLKEADSALRRELVEQFYLLEKEHQFDEVGDRTEVLSHLRRLIQNEAERIGMEET